MVKMEELDTIFETYDKTYYQLAIDGAGELDFAERDMFFPYDEIVVGEDVLGLFIILEGGNVACFAPDTLEIEDMEISFG